MDRLELDSADRGFYLIRSESPVPYILDLTSSQPRVMRFAIPTSADPLDNRWLDVVSVGSEQSGSVTVGSRVDWVVDTADHAGSSETRWTSLNVASIEEITGETREILSDPASLADLLEGLGDIEAGRTYPLDEVAAKVAKRVAPTEKANAAIERGGQDNESAAFMLEANRRLWLQNDEEWEYPLRGQAEGDPDTTAAAEERSRLLDGVLDEQVEMYREALDRLGGEDGSPPPS